ILPYKLYDGVTRAAFHLFPFRYDKEQFKGLSRSSFLRALRAEGIPNGDGYNTLNDMPYLDHAFNTKNFQRNYPQSMLDFDNFLERNRCPENDKLCNEEAVRLSQWMLLGDKSDMDDIAMGIVKIYDNAEKIKQSLD
ncbi:MAG: hypothetical protein WED82_02700, partial [Balneolales bacterium]